MVRDGIVIAEDEIASLKRFKDDAKEVAEGYECGVTLEKFADVKEGDCLLYTSQHRHPPRERLLRRGRGAQEGRCRR